MKKILLMLVVCVVTMGGNNLVVNAADYNPAEEIESSLYVNTKSVSTHIAFSGNTANCSVSVVGVSNTGSIRGTATLYDDTVGKVVTSWHIGSSNCICKSSKSVGVTKGHSYRLVFNGTVCRAGGLCEQISGSATAHN